MSDEMNQTPLTSPREAALATVQTMKQERLKLGLSLEQVAAAAGIRSGLLRMLEAGEFDRIGNAEIIQSALRAYGAFLQTKQTGKAKAATTVDSQAVKHERSQASSRPKRRRTLAWSLLIVAALAVAIAVFSRRVPPSEERPQGAIMGQLSLEREFGQGSSRQLADQPNFIRTQLAQQHPGTSTPPSEASVPEGAADSSLQPAQQADQDQQLPIKEQLRSSRASPAPAGDDSERLATSAADKEQRLLEARNGRFLPRHPIAELSQVSSANEPTQSASRGETGHTLELEANAECWLEVRIDDLKPLRELLKPGERRTYRVNQKAGLVIGNAGGVRIKWDGQLLTPAGKPGKVIRLQLPHAL